MRAATVNLSQEPDYLACRDFGEDQAEMAYSSYRDVSRPDENA